MWILNLSKPLKNLYSLFKSLQKSYKRFQLIKTLCLKKDYSLLNLNIKKKLPYLVPPHPKETKMKRNINNDLAVLPSYERELDGVPVRFSMLLIHDFNPNSTLSFSYVLISHYSLACPKRKEKKKKKKRNIDLAILPSHDNRLKVKVYIYIHLVV